MPETISYRFRLRRRLAAMWESLNEILLDSEIGLASDSRELKVGDGSTAWNDLPPLENGMQLSRLGDVDASTRANGKAIVWDSSSGTHVYVTVTGGGSGGGGSTIDAEVAADSPVAFWKLDEASGNLADSSGNGHTLTITGAPIDQYRFTALDRDFPARKTIAATAGGQSNYAANASALGLSLPLTTFTIEAWGAWVSSGIIAGLGASGETLATNFAFQMLLTSAGALSNFWEYGSGTNAPTISSLLGGALDGKLHHLVMTKDAATRTISYYIDGRYVGGGTYAAGVEHTGGTSGIFAALGHPAESVAAPDGVYAGIAFYSTVLSAARVQAHAEALGFEV